MLLTYGNLLFYSIIKLWIFYLYFSLCDICLETQVQMFAELKYYLHSWHGRILMLLAFEAKSAQDYSVFHLHYNAIEEEAFHIDSEVRFQEAHPLCSALSQRGLNPINLAYDTYRPDGQPDDGKHLWLGQYASRHGNRAYCYAEFAISSLTVAETISIASTYCVYPWRDGQAE